MGYEFSLEKIERAFDDAADSCECCGKFLSWSNQGRNGRGSWEAHHGSGQRPIILCTNGKENCHLNCGHDGDFQNEGITPRFHRDN